MAVRQVFYFCLLRMDRWEGCQDKCDDQFRQEFGYWYGPTKMKMNCQYDHQILFSGKPKKKRRKRTSRSNTGTKSSPAASLTAANVAGFVQNA